MDFDRLQTRSRWEGGTSMKRKKRQRTIGTTGDDARDGALAMLEDLVSIYVNRGRRIMLQAMLRAGFATADDVYGLLGLPSDIDPRCLGAVPKALASAGIIRAAGFVKSNRPQRNASYIRRWELVDRWAAVQWLAEHPDIPDPRPDGNGKARQLALPGLA